MYPDFMHIYWYIKYIYSLQYLFSIIYYARDTTRYSNFSQLVLWINCADNNIFLFFFLFYTSRLPWFVIKCIVNIAVIPNPNPVHYNYRNSSISLPLKMSTSSSRHLGGFAFVEHGDINSDRFLHRLALI